VGWYNLCLVDYETLLINEKEGLTVKVKGNGKVTVTDVN
jgi:hypothetical protein